MKFKMIHENYNVSDLDQSIKFYNVALDLHEVRRKTTDDFIIVYLSNDVSDFVLLVRRLVILRLECQMEFAFTQIIWLWMILKPGKFQLKEMGCICYENEAMGIYFIVDPDGYWLEIVP